MTRKDEATVARGGVAESRSPVQPAAPVEPNARPARHANVVRELTKELTRRERLVLMLRYTEELTVQEIAAVLEIAATEVERMLESISERVRRKLAPVYGRPSPRLA